MNNSIFKLLSVIMLAICMLLFNACNKDEERLVPVPEITGFSPASGVQGDEVTITGQNFSATASENTVKFNGKAATVTSATATSLKATVPEGATTGKLTVSVNGKEATSENDFTVLQIPVISSFSPESGLAGDTITITGQNFSATASENTVKFNGTSATVTVATSIILKATVPEGATTGKLTVSVNGKEVTSEDDFTVLQIPVVSSFSPESGRKGDTITITGAHFSTEVAENTVKFGSVVATVTSATATALTAIVPAEAVTGKITVSVNGEEVTSENDFEVFTNFALMAVASASSTYPDYSPGNANDGDTNTSLGSAYSWTNAHTYGENGKLPQWLELDFGATKRFTRVVLYTSDGFIIQDFQVQYWDGADWVTIVSIVGNTELVSTYVFDAIESDKVRIYATKGSVNQTFYARINEVEVWDK